MPILPSGRRIDFSLDRFTSFLARVEPLHARAIAAALRDPDDLLPVLDAVHYSPHSGAPFFANYVAADWECCAADWPAGDREALRHWFDSASARHYRAEAIRLIRQRLGEQGKAATPSQPAARIATHAPLPCRFTAETTPSLDPLLVFLPVAQRLH
jgi:hypothetical protein